MPNLCKIQIMGHAGGNAELKTLPNGTSVLNWSVAVNAGRKDGEDEPMWFRCALFGKRAEALAPYIVKGAPLFVGGNFRVTEYRGGGGSPQKSLDINVDDVQFAGTKPQDNSDFRTRTPAPAVADDDTPF